MYIYIYIVIKLQANLTVKIWLESISTISQYNLDTNIRYRDLKCGWPFPHGQRDWAFTPSGGGDMEIQKAYLKYNLVTSSVCLRHD